MRPFILTNRAESDVRAARSYYDQTGADLGNRFIDAVQVAIDVARQRPESCPGVGAGVRALRCERFPYRVYFRVVTDRVIILAVYHTARDPDGWNDASRE